MPQEAVHHRQEIPGFGFAAEKWLLIDLKRTESAGSLRGMYRRLHSFLASSIRAFTGRCRDAHVRRIY